MTIHTELVNVCPLIEYAAVTSATPECVLLLKIAYAAPLLIVVVNDEPSGDPELDTNWHPPGLSLIVKVATVPLGAAFPAASLAVRIKVVL